VPLLRVAIGENRGGGWIVDLFHVEIGVNDIAGAVVRPFRVGIRETEHGLYILCILKIGDNDGGGGVMPPGVEMVVNEVWASSLSVSRLGSARDLHCPENAI
jgi:hypothetical protein